MKTIYVSPIGFLSGLHPMLSSHDAMKVLLDGPLQDLKFSFITTSQFSITQKEKKVNTTVVEIHVAADEAEHAREQLSIAWEDADFLAELKARAVSMPIIFILMIKHGIMNVATFREALRQQH
jgi:predicted RNA-binding protein with EMAP domain